MGIYDNRELSWLKFNLRVLEEAYTEKNPPLERLNFLSIVTSNLDEFFMVRVGGLWDKLILKDNKPDDKTGFSTEKQLELIYADVKSFYKKKRMVYDRVREVLFENGIRIYEASTLIDGKKNIIEKKFENMIRPFLSQQIVSLKNPFPHLENKSVYFAALITQKDKTYLGIVLKSCEISEIISVSDKDMYEFALTDEVILEQLPKLFSGYKVLEKCMVRITRSADTDIFLNEFLEEEDYRQKMKKILKKRKRLAPVRIEISRPVSKDFKKLILNKMKSEILLVNKNPLSFDFVSEITKRIPKELKDRLSYEPFTPHIPSWYSLNTDMFSVMKKGDILLNYPYDSMKPFIAFLEQAASDKNVKSIKITLYRVNANSRVINALLKAAEYGKDVFVVMELRARFSEQSNIDYSEILEEGGVRVIYGPDFYKVHSKICSVIRLEGDKTRYYTHIGTGNYNEKTATLYTDFNLFSAKEDLGREAKLFFDNLSTNTLRYEYNILVTSPFGIENMILEKLDELIEYNRLFGNARAILKCNSITQKSVIDKIYEASKAGVKISLIVRGICSLIPDEDVSENLKIISIVGRFLEHSRVYSFFKGDDSEVYISSSDLMTRNLEKRVELAVPIRDEKLKNQVVDYLKKQLSDDVKARRLNENGQYENANESFGFDSQMYFSKEEVQEVKKTIKPQKQKYPNYFKWLFKKEEV